MRIVLLGEGWRLGRWDGGVRFQVALQGLVTTTLSDDPLNTTISDDPLNTTRDLIS